MNGDKKRTKAETLAMYITQNLCYCPIDDAAPVPDCRGWCTDRSKCVKCILRHTDAVYVYPYDL